MNLMEEQHKKGRGGGGGKERRKEGTKERVYFCLQLQGHTPSLKDIRAGTWRKYLKPGHEDSLLAFSL